MAQTQRATCWSITINNPVDSDYPAADTLPPGWSYEGQIEQGEQGTTHYQGMLKTPQVRFSQVKKYFPRAHIEVAKNVVALKKYVHKTDTRLEEVPTVRSTTPTMWDYQDVIARLWDPEEFEKICEQDTEAYDKGDSPLVYVDRLISREIRKGVKGIEYIAVNPLWRSAWKKFYKDIIFRALFIEDASDNSQKNSQINAKEESDEEINKSNSE